MAEWLAKCTALPVGELYTVSFGPVCINNHAPLHTLENQSASFNMQLCWENPSHAITTHFQHFNGRILSVIMRHWSQLRWPWTLDLTAPKLGASYRCMEEYAQKCEIYMTFYFRFISLYEMVREKADRLNREMSIQLLWAEPYNKQFVEKPRT